MSVLQSTEVLRGNTATERGSIHALRHKPLTQPSDTPISKAVPSAINSIVQTEDKQGFVLDIASYGGRPRIDGRGFIITLSPADMLLIADKFYGVRKIR